MLQLKANPVMMAASTHLLLRIGNVPGNAASKKETCELGGAKNPVAALENNFDSEAICAWISNPITGLKEHNKLVTKRIVHTQLQDKTKSNLAFSFPSSSSSIVFCFF